MSVYEAAESDKSLLEALHNSGTKKALVKKRGLKRQAVTKTISKLSGPCETEGEIKFFIQKLNGLMNELVRLDCDIEDHMIENELWSDSEHARQAEINEQYLDKIQHSLINLESKLNNLNMPVLPEPVNVGTNALSKIKLPEIQFPVFAGTPEKYRRFIDSLESILNKFNLTSFEKYSYLRQQVSGSARDIVESLPDENLSYEAAKALLESAFSDKTTQQFSVIEQLSKLRLNSEEDFYQWISAVRQLENQIDSLEIDGAVFAQYFLWRNMGDCFKKQFMAVSNCAKPSLREIIDNSFEVVKRMGTVSSEPNVRGVKSVALATKVNYSSKSKSSNFNPKIHCGLCHSLGDNKDFNHKIYKCEQFPSPQSKIRKLNELSGCTRCGFLNHTVDVCNYKFNDKCFNCNKYHFYFLCSNNERNSISHKKECPPKDCKKSNAVQSSTLATEFVVLQAQSPSSNVILPTLTAKINKNASNTRKDVRVLYDPASQSSFISEKLLKKIKHKVIKKDVNVKILGFNSSRSYQTKVVEIQCDIGNRNIKLSAVVVPEIGIKLNAEHLSEINEEFYHKSIDLADIHLNENHNIEILLGADQSHQIPIHSCRFGSSSNPSLLYYSNAGVILVGNSLHLKNNLPHLNFVQSFIDKCNSAF